MSSQDSPALFTISKKPRFRYLRTLTLQWQWLRQLCRLFFLTSVVLPSYTLAQSGQPNTTDESNPVPPEIPALLPGEVGLEADYLDQPDDTRYRLKGSVVIERDQQRLQADTVDVNLLSGQVDLKGNVTLTEPRFRVTGSGASMNREQGQASIDDAELELQSTPLKAKADRIYRFQNHLRLRETSISSCPIPEKGWSFERVR